MTLRQTFTNWTDIAAAAVGIALDAVRRARTPAAAAAPLTPPPDHNVALDAMDRDRARLERELRK